MTQATTKDYWISPSALYIELNALGNPDYIQASCVSGAQILVYVKDIIGYDAGHNYRRWTLQAAPTVFNSHTEKYVYAAIPRDMTIAASAWIVFPSEPLDIYGKNEKGEQIGDEKYYYINLQGVITSSGENGTEQRDWKQRISTGYLSSDEAISAVGNESEWYKYSTVDEIVTFLKNLTMKEGVKFCQLFVSTLTIVSHGSFSFENGGRVDGVASEQTPLESSDKVVTPKYLDSNAISKVKEDVAQKTIRFLEGLSVGKETPNGLFGISSDGIATLKEIVSSVFSSGALGTGFKLGAYGDTGDSYLEVDRMLVRKAAEFVTLVIRELRSVGGEIILSPASMKCTRVAAYSKDDIEVTEENALPIAFYRCYFQQEADSKALTNDFVIDDLVRCQQFNIKEGATSGAKNRYYWRKCVGKGDDYIDLSAIDCDADSDAPMAGDELVLLGNSSDATRQSAITLSAYGADAPSIKLYRGINSYSLANKEVFVVSREEVYILADKLRYRNTDGSYVSVGDVVASLTADINGIQTSVKALRIKQNDQGETISELSSRMTQTEEAITQEVSERKKYVDGQVETLNSTITQTANSISLKVAQSQNTLSNIFVGSAFREWDSLNNLKTKYPTKCYTGGIGGSRYARISVANAADGEWAGIRFGNYNLLGKKDVKYTCSVWVRIREVVASECYLRINYKVPLSATSTILSTMQFDGTKTGDWVLYKADITIPTNTCTIWADICVIGNGVVDVCRPMLNEGEYIGWSMSPNDVTESGNLEKKVKTTGLDIENEKIIATADKFEVRNNNGDTTASVSAKGVLEVDSGVFTGFVKKKPTVITPDNFDSYKSTRSLQAGYVEMDFEKTGSFLVFSGDLKAKLNGSYIAITLPCTGSVWTTTDYTDKEHPLAYIGQQFVVVNDSTASITIAGGGTIRKNGSETTGVEANVVDNGTLAVLTCTVATSYSTLGNTYKAAWNGIIYKQ